QSAVAFVDAADNVTFVGLGIHQQEQAAPTAAVRTLHLTQIAVGTSSSTAQFGQQLGFKIWRNGMLQSPSPLVHLVPLHAKHFRQHELDQMMAKGKLARDLAPSGSEADMTIGLYSYKTVFL